MSQKEITTILGPDASFDGKLTFQGALRIDGRFSGEIHTEGTLVVGERAVVEAQIRAGDVIVQGRVTGNISASGSLEIRGPAQVHGNLDVGSLLIEPGSVFEGNCKMGRREDASAANDASSAAQ